MCPMHRLLAYHTLSGSKKVRYVSYADLQARVRQKRSRKLEMIIEDHVRLKLNYL